MDGSVECFKGNHIPLALFALMWGIFLVFLIPVPLLLVYKTKLVCCTRPVHSNVISILIYSVVIIWFQGNWNTL